MGKITYKEYIKYLRERAKTQQLDNLAEGILKANGRIEELEERIEALEQLLVCYRIGKNPSEALHRKLEKTKQALKGK